MSYKITALVNILKGLGEANIIRETICHASICDWNCDECPFKNTETLPGLIIELETLNEGG